MEPEGIFILQPIPVLSQINPVHALPFNLFKIYFNIILHLHLGVPSGLFLSTFFTKSLYVFLLSPVCAITLLNINVWLYINYSFASSFTVT